MECEHPDDQFVGYRDPGANRNEYGGADFKEMFHIGTRYAPTLDGTGAVDVAAAVRSTPLWPADLPEFVVAWHRYYGVMQEVAADLADVFALALGVDADVLADLWADNTADLAANYYPVGGASDAGRVRNAAHADMTLFTVLHQDGRAGGLAIEWADGAWEPVDLDGTAFLVNIGQLFELITGGRWRAVPHEVRPAAEPMTDARVTIPFFFRPRLEAVLALLPGCEPADADAPAPQTLSQWLTARRRRVAVPTRPD